MVFESILTLRPLGAFAAIALCALAFPIENAPGRRADALHFALDTARTRIWFDANASLGAFSGTAQSFRGFAEVEDTGSLAGAAGRIEIDVASFRTGIGMRDGHLRDDLDADEHPTITWALTGVERVTRGVVAATVAETPDEPERQPVLLSGLMTFHGVARDVQIPAFLRFTPDSLYVRGRVDVRFTDFAMKPPSRMLGLAKVDDIVVLRFDAVFGNTP